MSNVAAPAPQIAATRWPDTGISAQNGARAAPSIRNRQRPSNWFAWILAASALAAGITAAFSLNLVPSEFVDAMALAKQRVSAVVSSRGYVPRRSEPNSGVPVRAQIAARDQRGPVNQPLPLGLSIRDGSGSEIVVLEGLGEGAELSVGTSLREGQWSMPARDLDKAFVGAPKDFRGPMEVTAKLYSSSNDLLQTMTIRLAWEAAPIEGLSPREAVRPAMPAPAFAPTPASVPSVPNPPHALPVTPSQAFALMKSGPSPTISSPNPHAEAAKTSRPPEEVDALLHVGERMLWEGDVAAARVALQRAAEAGNAQAAQDLRMSFDPAFLRAIETVAAPGLAPAGDW